MHMFNLEFDTKAVVYIYVYMSYIYIHIYTYTPLCVYIYVYIYICIDLGPHEMDTQYALKKHMEKLFFCFFVFKKWIF